MKISAIGLDLAKNWFQVHGVAPAGQVIVRRRLRRSEVLAYFQSIEPCLVGMEACATAHYWARELTALGHGIIGASAIAATVADPTLFRSGREFAAWLGMTPKQNSSGGKERLGGTSKRGDKYIRSLLVTGAVAILRHVRHRTTKDAAWIRGLLARKPAKVAAVALANKTARIVWAVMARGEAYRSKDLIGLAA